MVEMTVFGLALDEDSQMPILILKDTSEDIIFPIWIGAMPIDDGGIVMISGLGPR